MITEEELRAILGMADIGGLESQLAQSSRLASDLRDKVGTGAGGGGLGGNIARAGYGISSAMNDYRARQRQPQISAAKQSLLQEILKRRKEQQQQQQQQPQTTYGETGDSYYGGGGEA
jgi:hypothetical protein